MPTYEYFCETCGLRQDAFFRIADRPDQTPCRKCGRPAQFMISAPAIRCDGAVNVPWLRDFARTRKEARFGEKPIETRQEYHRYLKEKNLRDPHQGENLTEV